MKPNTKITSTAIAGALTVLIVFALGRFGVDIPADISSAITLVISAVTGYLVPESSELIKYTEQDISVLPKD